MTRDTETQVHELIREMSPGGIQPVSDEEAVVALVALYSSPEVPGDLLYAAYRTRRLVTPTNQHLFSEVEVAEWQRTLAAYRGRRRVGSSTMTE
jgi:hypothetical protein